jgi:hypothetical protein
MSHFTALSGITFNFFDDPNFRKYGSDIEDVGGDFLATVGMEAGVAFNSLSNVYHFDGGKTTLGMIGLLGMPEMQNSSANVSLLATTYFEDGMRFCTTNAPSSFRRDIGLPVRGQTLAGVTDVAEILTKHRAGVEKMVAEGRRVRTLTREQSLERLELDFEESRETIQKLGYFTLWDAFLWTFDLDLKPKP